MPDQNDQTQQQDPVSEPIAEPTQGDEAKGFVPITSQEQFNRMTTERVARALKPFADYADVKAKAEAFGKLGLTPDEVAALSRDKQELQAKLEQAQWREQVQRETGVPADVLRGATLDEMQQHAASIKQAFAAMKPAPTAPIVPNDKGPANPTPMTRGQILAIEDDSTRRAAIAANLDLFE